MLQRGSSRICSTKNKIETRGHNHELNDHPENNGGPGIRGRRDNVHEDPDNDKQENRPGSAASFKGKERECPEG